MTSCEKPSGGGQIVELQNLPVPGNTNLKNRKNWRHQSFVMTEQLANSCNLQKAVFISCISKEECFNYRKISIRNRIVADAHL